MTDALYVATLAILAVGGLRAVELVVRQEYSARGTVAGARTARRSLTARLVVAAGLGVLMLAGSGALLGTYVQSWLTHQRVSVFDVQWQGAVWGGAAGVAIAITTALLVRARCLHIEPTPPPAGS
jgi:hypothetical protein